MKKQQVYKEMFFIITTLMVAALILLSNASQTRSALNYQSQIYNASIGSSSIGVSLVENGHKVASRDNIINNEDNAWSITAETLLQDLPMTDIKIGVPYNESLSVANSGEINEYVRLIIKTYWKDTDGKRVDLDPSLIHLEYINQELWIRDDSWAGAQKHPETVILYYKDILSPGDITAPATKTLTINGIAAQKVTETVAQTANGKMYTSTYTYNGLQFVVEAEADAIQTGHASDAMLSAWGTDAYTSLLQ